MLNKAVFLDRDGVINIDKGYISDIKDFKFNKDIFPLLRYFMNKGFLLIIVTNQSGVGRGYFTKDDLYKIHRYMLRRLRNRKIKIDAIYSAYSPDDGNYFRKPNIGMLIKAKNKFNLDMGRSVLIGDKETDIMAGKMAGVGRNILLLKNIAPDYCTSRLLNIKGLIK